MTPREEAEYRVARTTFAPDVEPGPHERRALEDAIAEASLTRRRTGAPVAAVNRLPSALARLLGVGSVPGPVEPPHRLLTPARAGFRRCVACREELPKTPEHFTRREGGWLASACKACKKLEARTRRRTLVVRAHARDYERTPRRVRGKTTYERSARGRARERRYAARNVLRRKAIETVRTVTRPALFGRPFCPLCRHVVRRLEARIPDPLHPHEGLAFRCPPCHALGV